MAMEEDTEQMNEAPKTESQDGHKKLEVRDDEQSPRSVYDIPILDSDLSNSSSSCSSFSTGNSSDQRPLVRKSYGSRWKGMLESWKKKSAKKISTVPLQYELATRSFRKKLTRIQSADDAIVCDEASLPTPPWRNFDYAELATAADNFSTENLIGKGGHAKVFKGYLADGQIVAVKRLNKKDSEDRDRTGDFLSELGIIAHIDHPNAARMLGFGTDGGLHLVLQFSPKGSLASMLHGSTETLEWKIRFKVAVGVAAGLKYLHQECQRCIIHRDIKASNILLTEDYEAQISDFGLAKWLPEKWTHHVVFPIEGTFGYLAPEYFMHGIVDEKTDVFAFGVLLLEIITGRRAIDSSRQSLAMWAKPLLGKNSVKELADPRLGDSYDPNEMKRAMFTASVCINHLSTLRPSMARVVQLLQGENASIELKQKLNGGRAVMLDAFDMEDYTATTYLNDLNRHMQLVLE